MCIRDRYIPAGALNFAAVLLVEFTSSVAVGVLVPMPTFCACTNVSEKKDKVKNNKYCFIKVNLIVEII